MKKVILGTVVLGLALFVIANVSAEISEPKGENLIINPGFEDGKKGWLTHTQKGVYIYTIDTEEKYKGKKSARVEGKEKGWARWYQSIPVEKGAEYYFSIWVKSEGSGLIWLHQKAPEKVICFGLTEGKWKEYIVPKIIATGDRLTIFLRNFGTGSVWFDEVKLTLIKESLLSKQQPERTIIIGSTGGIKIPLVENSYPVAKILIPPNPKTLEKRAASELRRYIFKITGAKLSIISGIGNPSDTYIQVGATNYAKKFVNPAILGKEGFIIKGDKNGKNLIICGGTEQGTLWGVYAFLYKAGCRWPIPNPIWRSIPKAKSLAVGLINEISRPDFSVRAYHYPNQTTGFWEWMAFNRMNYYYQNPPGYIFAETMQFYGIKPLFASHSFFYWVPKKLFKEHPDWAPMINGKRRIPTTKGAAHYVNTQLCLSNPGLVKHITNEILNYMKQHPAIEVVSLEANDGRGYCECPECTAMGPDSSTRFFAFVKKVAQVAYAKYPNHKIGVLAYSNHRDPPKIKLPSNLLIGITQYNNSDKTLDDPANMESVNRLKAWANTKLQLYIYYYFDKVHWPDYMQPNAHLLGYNLKKVYKPLAISGISAEVSRPGDLPSMIPGNYIYMRMLWNSSLNVDAQIRDLCNRMFGQAAEPMYKYYQTLEKRASIYSKSDSVCDLSKFIIPIAKTCQGYLQQALATANVEGGDILKRVKQEKRLFDYSLNSALGWCPAKSVHIPEIVYKSNKVKNPGFEEGKDFWIINTQKGKFDYEIVPEESFKGENSAVIHTIQPGWGRYYQKVKDLDQTKKYVFSVAIKTKDMTGTGDLWLIDGVTKTKYYSFGAAEDEWMRFTIHNRPAPNRYIALYLTSKGNTGNIYWDDVIICEEEIWQKYVRNSQEVKEK